MSTLYRSGLVLLEGEPDLAAPRSDSVELGAYLQLASRLSIVPTLIVFLITQRRLVEGVATTGLRG